MQWTIKSQTLFSVILCSHSLSRNIILMSFCDFFFIISKTISISERNIHDRRPNVHHFHFFVQGRVKRDT